MARKKRNSFKYKAVDTTTYDCDDRGFKFSLIINGVESAGFWRPTFKYTPGGVDTNEVIVNDKRIKIFDGGGSYRTYEVSGEPILKEKQPKNLSFTGRYYDTKNLGPILVNKIKEGLKNNLKGKLSQEFLDTFDLKIDDLQHNRDEKLKQLLGNV